jgi:4-hydroxy-2-oxoheptanedioate aldolase
MAVTRASSFGLRDAATYLEDANRETLLIVQVETRDAVEHLPSILDVPGVDAILLGPGDLSQSLGHPGQFDLPLVRRVMERVVEQTRAHGLPVGMFVLDAASARHWRDLGCRMLLYSADTLFLAAAAGQTLKEWREGTED